MSDTLKRTEEAIALLREGIQKNDDTVIQSVITVLLEIFITQQVVHTEALMQIARATTAMANPPVHVKGDIGFSAAVLSGKPEIVLTEEQAANLREEMYYLLARAFDCGVGYNPEKHFMAEKKRKDLYDLARESVGVVRKALS